MLLVSSVENRRYQHSSGKWCPGIGAGGGDADPVTLPAFDALAEYLNRKEQQ